MKVTIPLKEYLVLSVKAAILDDFLKDKPKTKEKLDSAIEKQVNAIIKNFKEVIHV